MNGGLNGGLNGRRQMARLKDDETLAAPWRPFSDGTIEALVVTRFLSGSNRAERRWVKQDPDSGWKYEIRLTRIWARQYRRLRQLQREDPEMNRVAAALDGADPLEVARLSKVLRDVEVTKEASLSLLVGTLQDLLSESPVCKHPTLCARNKYKHACPYCAVKHALKGWSMRAK